MNVKSAIEGILFLQGSALEVSRLTKITGAPKKEVLGALAELQAEYRERGIVLISDHERWQFATHPANKAVVEAFRTSEVSGELSRAALEVLAIIGYQGPITRARVEFVRGVDSSFSLRTLLIRGLVEREENPADRRSYLYRITPEFLKHLGLSSPDDLPRYAEFRSAGVEPPGGSADATGESHGGTDERGN